MNDRTRDVRTTTPKGDDRRIALLEACEKLLAEKSFVQLQISEISRQAGLTRSSFYFYFPTKAAIVSALLAAVTDELLVAISSWYEGHGDVRERISTGTQRSVEVWRRHAVLFAATIDAAAVDPDVSREWWALFEGFRGRVAARVRKDVGDELPARRGPSADALAGALTSLAFHVMERDVRSILLTGSGVPEVEETLTFAYLRLIYGESA